MRLVDEDVATLIVGPLVGGFTKWIEQRCTAEGTEKLFFASREGWHLQRHWQRSASATNVDSAYLLTSRLSLSSCLLDDPAALEVILRHPYTGSVEDLLAHRLGIDEDFLRSRLLRILPGRVDLARDRPRVKHALVTVIEELRPAVAQKRMRMLDYLDSVGFIGSAAQAFVDIGYSGTIPALLCHLVDADAFTKWQIIGTPTFFELDRSDAFLGCSSWRGGDPALDASLLLEGVLQAPHGSLQGFSPAGDPVFANHHGTPARWASLQRVHRLAEAWISDHGDTFGNVAADGLLVRLGMAGFVCAAALAGPEGMDYLEIDDNATGSEYRTTWFQQAMSWFDRSDFRSGTRQLMPS